MTATALANALDVGINVVYRSISKGARTSSRLHRTFQAMLYPAGIGKNCCRHEHDLHYAACQL